MMTSIEPEWRWKSLSERLAFAYSNNLFTDINVTVILGRNPFKFKAHKCILAHYSPVLEKRIYGDPATSISHIELNNLDPEGFSYVLRYLYRVPTDFQNAADKSLILSAYHTAQVLKITSISTQFRDEIFTNLLTPSLITKDNFWKVLELSTVLKLEDVTRELLKLAQNYSIDILKAKSFVKSSAITVKRVLDLDILNVAETDVLEAIARWTSENSGLPFADAFVRDLMGCVRFRNLSAEDFCRFAEKNRDLVTREDKLKIIIHLSKPSVKALPFWCSNKFRISKFKDNKKSKRVTFAEVFPPNHLSLLNLFTDQKSGDVIFRVMSESDPIFIKAHRKILGIGSLVFERMFFGPLANSRYDIEVKVSSSEGFRTMIRYFYDDSDLDSLLTQNPALASGLLDSALKYGSNILRNTCLKPLNLRPSGKVYSKQNALKPVLSKSRRDIVPIFSTKKVNGNETELVSGLVHGKSRQEFPERSDSFRLGKNNVSIDVVNSASFWKQLEKLARQNRLTIESGKELLNYATKYTKEVLNSNDFLSISRNALVTFLSLDLSVQGINLLNRVAEWIEQKPTSIKTKHEVLGRIQFDDLTTQEFCSFLSRHERVLPKEDSLAILRHLVDKSFELPEWCYRTSRKDNNIYSESDGHNYSGAAVTNHFNFVRPLN